VRTPRKAERRWKRVRRGRGKYVRHVKVRASRKVVRYRKARTRREQRRARWVRTRHAPLKSVYVTTTQARRECSAERFGAAYRKLWDAVAPVIQRYDPDARLVVADLAPGPMPPFMEAFYADGQPTVRPDILGSHYPDAERAKADVEYARARDLEPWVTEWARTAWDKFNSTIHSTPADWARCLNELEAAGMRVTVIYDTAAPTWDTRMSDAVVEAVRSR
jgi:hypothetical protein